jgi:hypothetical protein
MRQSFIVNVLYQEHSTWQGTVTWVDENKTQTFRSALELLRLIDSTMDCETHMDWKEATTQE